MPIRFTLEANAIRSDAPDWQDEIAALLKLASQCQAIEILRTPGARRERSRFGAHPTAEGVADAAIRADLMASIPSMVEAFTIGASELDDEEAQLTLVDERPVQDRIGQAVFGKQVADLEGSDLEDVVHLQTHLRHGRDAFITTDLAILGAAPKLQEIGVRVMPPGDGLSLARSVCSGREITGQ